MLEMRVQLNIWTKATRRFVMKIYKSFREISDGDFCWILRIWEKRWWRFLKCRNLWVLGLKYFDSAATQKCSKSKTIKPIISTFEQTVMEVSKMHESQTLYRGAAGICTFYAFSNWQECCKCLFLPWEIQVGPNFKVWFSGKKKCIGSTHLSCISA